MFFILEVFLFLINIYNVNSIIYEDNNSEIIKIDTIMNEKEHSEIINETNRIETKVLGFRFVQGSCSDVVGFRDWLNKEGKKLYENFCNQWIYVQDDEWKNIEGEWKYIDQKQDKIKKVAQVLSKNIKKIKRKYGIILGV